MTEVHDEMASFWERRGHANPTAVLSSLFAEFVAPSPRDSYEGSPGSIYDWDVEREYLRFVATGPSDEELVEWLRCMDVVYAEAP